MSENIRDKFRYVTDKTDSWTAIALDGGKFDGVIYKYGKVTLPEEENKKGDLPFRFEYDILDPYGFKQEDFDEEFFRLIGDILVSIIDEQLENKNLEYSPDN